jgi:hypothetical protein
MHLYYSIYLIPWIPVHITFSHIQAHKSTWMRSQLVPFHFFPCESDVCNQARIERLYLLSRLIQRAGSAAPFLIQILLLSVIPSKS